MTDLRAPSGFGGSLGVWPGAQGVAGPSTRKDSWAGVIDVLAFAAGMFLVLTYSQSFAAPATGYIPSPYRAELLRNLMMPAYAVGLFLLALTWRQTLAALAPNILLVALLALAFLTMAWSIDPPGTFRRAFALAFTTLAGVSLAARFSWRTLAELIAAAYAINAVISLLLGAAYPAWGRMHEIFPGAWRGLWLEKNALGGMMAAGALTAVAAAVYVPRRALLWGGVSLLCIALVVLSQSKTSLLSVVVGFGVIALVWLVRRGAVAALIGVWLAVAGAVAIASLFFFFPELIFTALGKDATLTGRTEIWTAAWRQLMNGNQWTGFGYGGVLWDNAKGWAPAAWIAKHARFTAGHAHNGWIEAALNFGFGGLILWSLYYLQVIGRGAVRLFTGGGAYLALPFLVIFTLRSVTEVSVLDYHDLEWVIFVCFAVKLGMDKDRDAPG